MEIEIAKQERMSETGRSLLRLIQNNDMPVLDLLVREAVQNSLDASLGGEGYVQVDFHIRSFKRALLSSHLGDIETRMNEVFPAEEYRLMEIRDCNTHGLTGPLHDGEVAASEYGNLIKLIYQIGMPQQKEGSGGSWGLGKTVYFRIGIGLVVYYSRICENGEYFSRLAACLVEDDSKETALLKNKGNHRGIAWWGQRAVDGKTMPLTDESEIASVLESLGCLPFQGNETGTAILIPFMRDDLRPELTISTEDEMINTPQNTDLPWSRTDEEYIFASIQRWYAPRLMNEKYPNGRWLRAAVNGVGIAREKFLPAFQVLQDLYNYANLSASNGNPAVQDENQLMKVVQVRLNNTFKSGPSAGWVAFAKLTAADLKMTPPNNHLSPWAQALGMDFQFDNNPPLLAYTRRPGMIVGYEYSGKWVEGIPKTREDEFLIGIFVANSSNPLSEANPKNPDKDFLLEEYIRNCEKADHTSWTDWTPNKKNLLIIDRIQGHVRRGIAKTYSERNANDSVKKDVVLGKLLANVLLPPDGFGTSPAGQPKPPGPGGGGHSAGRKPKLVNIAPPIYEGDIVRLDFELHTGKDGHLFSLSLKVISESGEIDADNWEGDEGVGSKFPISLVKAVIRSISAQKSGANECNDNIILSSLSGSFENEGIRIAGIGSQKFKQFCGISCAGMTNKMVKGSFWVRSSDRNIRAAISVDVQPGGENP